MKTCTACGRSKVESEFSRNRTKKDGLQCRCKECSRSVAKDHYTNNTNYYKERNKTARKRLLDTVQQIKDRPCQDCGGSFPPYVMDFDHRDGTTKTGGIASLVKHLGSIQQVLLEVSKCDVVCANCHRIRTHARLSGACTKSSKRFK